MEQQRQDDYYVRRFDKMVRQLLIRDSEERIRRSSVERDLQHVPFVQRPSEIDTERRRVFDYDRRRQELADMLEASVPRSRNLSVPAGP